MRAVYLKMRGMRAKNGRGNRTRTCDLMLPKHALYQTELYPDVPKMRK